MFHTLAVHASYVLGNLCADSCTTNSNSISPNECFCSSTLQFHVTWERDDLVFIFLFHATICCVSLVTVTLSCTRNTVSREILFAYCTVTMGLLTCMVGKPQKHFCIWALWSLLTLALEVTTRLYTLYINFPWINYRRVIHTAKLRSVADGTWLHLAKPVFVLFCLTAHFREWTYSGVTSLALLFERQTPDFFFHSVCVIHLHTLFVRRAFVVFTVSISSTQGARGGVVYPPASLN